MSTVTNAMTEIAIWSNQKVSVVTHEALAQHCPELLHSHHERTAKKADNPDLLAICEHTGMLLATAATAPIWERNIKCTMSNGFVFYVCDHMQYVGGQHFRLAEVFPKWIGEADATYDIVDNEPEWADAVYSRVSGLRPGSMLVVEDGANDRIVFADEVVATVVDVKRHLSYLNNGNWTMADWTRLRGFTIDTNHQFGWLQAHKGQRIALATCKSATIWIYITA